MPFRRNAPLQPADIGEHHCQRLLVPSGASLDALGD
jgi:hypothetical protein